MNSNRETASRNENDRTYGYESQTIAFLHFQVIITFSTIIDLIVLYVEIFTNYRIIQPFRCFRMMLLACWNIQVGHIFSVLISIFMSLLRIVLAIWTFIVALSALGMHVFLETYHLICVDDETGKYYKFPTYSVDNLPTECPDGYTPSEYSQSYDNIFIASFRMFILLTTENYPDVMIPAYWILSPSTWFYFGFFILVGLYLLQSFILAVIVDAFWSYNKKTLKMDREISRITLIKAWNLLDIQNEGKIEINSDLLDKLVIYLRPELKKDEDREIRLALIDSLDTQRDGFVDSYDWNLHGFDLVTLAIEKNEEGKEDNWAGRFINQGKWGFYYETYFLRWRQMFILIIGGVHSCLFLIKFPELSEEADLIIHFLRLGLSIIYLLEAIVNYFYIRYRDKSNEDTAVLLHEYYFSVSTYPIFDITITFLSVLTNLTWIIVEQLIYRTSDFSLVQEAVIGSLDSIGGIVVLIRIGLYWKTSLRGIQIILFVLPALASLIVTIFIVLYFFAIIGLEAFMAFELTYSNEIDFTGSPQDYGCQFGFINFWCAFLACFQILTTNNWNDYVNTAILDSGSIFSAIYFIVVFMIFNFFVINIVTANVIEAYNRANTTFKEEEIERKEQVEELKKIQEERQSLSKSRDENDYGQRDSQFSASNHFTKSPRATYRGTARKTTGRTGTLRVATKSSNPNSIHNRRGSILLNNPGQNSISTLTGKYQIVDPRIKRRQSLAMGINKLPVNFLQNLNMMQENRESREKTVEKDNESHYSDRTILSSTISPTKETMPTSYRLGVVSSTPSSEIEYGPTNQNYQIGIIPSTTPSPNPHNDFSNRKPSISYVGKGIRISNENLPLGPRNNSDLPKNLRRNRSIVSKSEISSTTRSLGVNSRNNNFSRTPTPRTMEQIIERSTERDTEKSKKSSRRPSKISIKSKTSNNGGLQQNNSKFKILKTNKRMNIKDLQKITIIGKGEAQRLSAMMKGEMAKDQFLKRDSSRLNPNVLHQNNNKVVPLAVENKLEDDQNPTARPSLREKISNIFSTNHNKKDNYNRKLSVTNDDRREINQALQQSGHLDYRRNSADHQVNLKNAISGKSYRLRKKNSIDVREIQNLDDTVDGKKRNQSIDYIVENNNKDWTNGLDSLEKSQNQTALQARIANRTATSEKPAWLQKWLVDKDLELKKDKNLPAGDANDSRDLTNLSNMSNISAILKQEASKITDSDTKNTTSIIFPGMIPASIKNNNRKKSRKKSEVSVHFDEAKNTVIGEKKMVEDQEDLDNKDDDTIFENTSDTSLIKRKSHQRKAKFRKKLTLQKNKFSKVNSHSNSESYRSNKLPSSREKTNENNSDTDSINSDYLKNQVMKYENEIQTIVPKIKFYKDSRGSSQYTNKSFEEEEKDTENIDS